MLPATWFTLPELGAAQTQLVSILFLLEMKLFLLRHQLAGYLEKELIGGDNYPLSGTYLS